jgi:hypothetical protein
MTGWIKLTSAQAAQIAALSASNPGDNFITPRSDAIGHKWIFGDVLDEPAFSYYASVLSTLTVTQQNEPSWPASPL